MVNQLSLTEAWLWSDGGSRRNPGPAAIGVVVKNQIGDIVHTEYRYLGDPVSNNQAEYRAVYAAVLFAQEHGIRRIHAHLDSQLVVEQLNGRFKVKDAGLQQWWSSVRVILDSFESWDIRYVPRAQNSEADALVNQCLDEATYNT